MKTLNGFRKDQFVKVYTELEKIAIVQSVKNSNAIEGILMLIVFDKKSKD